MTSEVQMALITAIPPTIASIGGIIIAVYSSRKADKKLNHITVLTNSTLTAANEKIADLKDTILRKDREIEKDKVEIEKTISSQKDKI